MKARLALSLFALGCARPPPPEAVAPTRPTPPPIPVDRAYPDHAPLADELLIRLHGDVSRASVELVCSEGYRERLELVPDEAGVTGLASFRGLAPDACTVYFKGTAPARFEPVSPGRAYDCRLVGTTGLCEPAAWGGSAGQN